VKQIKMNIERKYKIPALMILLALSIKISAQTEPVTLHRSEVYHLTSTVSGIQYPVYVALPGSYNYTKDSYPVIYMLDAYSSFGILVQMQRLLAFNKEIPEAIIVGISSEGGSKEFNYNRSRDYTPTNIPADSLPNSIRAMIPVSGGAEKFLSFIKNDLMKFVETKFRCKPDDRTFVGHSLGGLFGFYTLLTQPELFRGYVIISPAVGWDKEYILKLEEKFFEQHKEIDAKVYTTIGSLEEKSFVEPWKRLTDSIKKHNYGKLVFDAAVSNNETHYTIIPYIATHGLKSVLDK
jgi:uncharacterized protein